MNTVAHMDISYINLSELKSYKKVNSEILPELRSFIDTSKVTSYWKHYDNPSHYQQARLNKTDLEKMSMSIRSLLNKIFDKNYSLVLDEIKRLDIDDKNKLTILVDIFFKKIVTERNNIALFLDVAKDLYEFKVVLLFLNQFSSGEFAILKFNFSNVNTFCTIENSFKIRFRKL